MSLSKDQFHQFVLGSIVLHELITADPLFAAYLRDVNGESVIEVRNILLNTWTEMRGEGVLDAHK